MCSSDLTIAVVGRPNVGKSTLVNRFCDAGKGGAITQNEAGVTRDRVYQRGEWCGRKFDVVDTGGLLFEDEENALFLEEIREQAAMALREACACVVVVDGRDGRTNADEDVARFLRKWPDKDLISVVAVNKCESPEKEPEMVADFWPLGLGEPVACSAIHGHGVAEVLDAVLPAVDKAIAANEARIAALLAGCVRELRQEVLGHQAGVTLDAHIHGLGEADAVAVDVHLDQLGSLGPVIYAVARQRGEGVQSRAQSQHHVGPGDDLHGGLGAIVA